MMLKSTPFRPFLLGTLLLGNLSEVNISKAEEAAKFEGVGSCASSQCHGSVNPRKPGNVLQNEYTTWKKHDPHAKAWASLQNADSRRIAEHLGIGAPEKEPMCLQCHSTFAPSSQLGEAYHAEDGVGCESCHGASEKWLSAHTASDATHENNVRLGMRELKNPQAQTKLCLSCHFGSDDKYVNHRLIGAGHPRLSFELDTFQSIEPRHWLVDEDYQARKASYDPVEAWFQGQFAQALESLNRLQSPKRSKQGIFPEFALFECSNCHHSLTEEQWKTKDFPGQPGNPRLNLSSLSMIREALETFDKGQASALAAEVESLKLNYVVGGSAPAASVNALKQKLQRFGKSLTHDHARQLLKHFAGYATREKDLTYETAEQLAMAFSVFVSAIDPSGERYRAELDAVYATLKNPKDFAAADFVKASSVFTKN